MITLPERITRETLLEHNSEEAYITRYTGMAPRKKPVKSPFREDKHPSCSFMRTSSGRILLYDFSRPEYTCDFIGAAMMRYSCSYREALRLIAEDFGIVPITQQRPPVIEGPLFNESKFDFNKDTFIQISAGKWEQPHLEWWDKYGITADTLNKFRVYRPDTVFLNGNVIYRGDRNVFAYFYKNGKTEEGKDIEYWRIYFPGRKRMKFVSNWKKDMIQGFRQLPESGKVLVITKSLKDVMCLYEIGIPAIAPCSETFFIPKEMLEELKKRFKYIIVFYDNDRAGMAGMAKIRREYPELFYIWIDKKYGCKDFSDLYEKYGKEKTLLLVEKMRRRINGMLAERRKVKLDNPKRFKSIITKLFSPVKTQEYDDWIKKHLEF